MATLRFIDAIDSIDGADAIEVATVGGWKVVTRKGEFKAGDLAVYCEIDSWIPHNIAPFLCRGVEPRKYNGVDGERLRTVKLRGQISQGLLLPRHVVLDKIGEIEVDMDVTEILGIQKWEAPIPAQLAGVMRGNFPSFIPKTDQERCISGDTLIDTTQGKLSIKEIVLNKMSVDVYSYNHETNLVELKKISDWSEMTRKNEWFKIKMKSGKELICTKNHMIWCNDISAYRRADQIQVGQKFITKTL